jgi:hypothetical protein
MGKNKQAWMLCLLLSVSGITVVAALHTRSQVGIPQDGPQHALVTQAEEVGTSRFTVVNFDSQDRKPGQLDIDDDSQVPVVDYDSSEPTDLKERAKREAKSRKYNRKYPDIGPDVIGGRIYHWPEGFPRLPVRQSNVIVIGGITEAHAYLSSDKNGVYSEFTLSVDEVLKDDSSTTQLKPGNAIVLEREGGRVRYPSAKVSQFSIIGWGMPRVGRRYVLFLTHNQQEQDFNILTGYELREGRVFPLDSSPGVVHFESYTNANEDGFLNELLAAIASCSQMTPK